MSEQLRLSPDQFGGHRRKKSTRQAPTAGRASATKRLFNMMLQEKDSPNVGLRMADRQGAPKVRSAKRRDRSSRERSTRELMPVDPRTPSGHIGLLYNAKATEGSIHTSPSRASSLRKYEMVASPARSPHSPKSEHNYLATSQQSINSQHESNLDAKKEGHSLVPKLSAGPTPATNSAMQLSGLPKQSHQTISDSPYKKRLFKRQANYHSTKGQNTHAYMTPKMIPEPEEHAQAREIVSSGTEEDAANETDLIRSGNKMIKHSMNTNTLSILDNKNKATKGSTRYLTTNETMATLQRNPSHSHFILKRPQF